MKAFRFWYFFAPAAALILSSCEPAPKSGAGMHLPEGNVEEGKAAFVKAGCNRCHTVSGVDLPAPEQQGPVQVELGGTILRVKTYGELITSITNPNHVVEDKYKADMTDAEGNSLMPPLNEEMTVAQLIDIVSFLHSRYLLLEPQYEGYEFYP